MDTRKRLNQAKRSEYYGSTKLPAYMRLSVKLEADCRKFAYQLERWRIGIIKRKLKPIFKDGDRVITPQGVGIVIKITTLASSNGGWIETDVEYDGNPKNSKKEYPYVGHYNQIFLEKEKP